MLNVKTITRTAMAALAIAAAPVSAKGIAPLATTCGLGAAKSFTACPAARVRPAPALRVDRAKLTAASVSADGRRQLDQLIASLN